MNLAPVAAFLFNRPLHAQRLLATLAANPLASQTDLFLYSDAPKTRADEEKVLAVRRVTRSVAGYRSISIIEREANWGLSRSITTAVDELSTRFGRVIAIEDDLVLAPGFLQFMNRALDAYERDERVLQISGFQFGLQTTPASRSVFLPLISCWGWATWARAWKFYEPVIKEHREVLADPELRNRFNLEGAYDYASMLESQRRGEVDSWGVRWHYSVFRQNGLVLYPPRSLVSNEGFDGSGTHETRMTGNLTTVTGAWPDAALFALPEDVVLSREALEEVKSILHSSRRPGLLARALRRLKR